MSNAIEQLINLLPTEQRETALTAVRAQFDKEYAMKSSTQQQLGVSVSSPPPMNPSSIDITRPLVKPSPPESFNGNRTKIQQFLVQLRRYLLLANLTTATESRQVEYGAQYLSGEALVWFENIQRSETPITTLLELETKLLAHFLPYGIQKLSRSKLRQLQQTGTVQSYSTIFMQTLQNITNMHLEDQIESYLEGLKPSIRLEVARKDFTLLHELMDYAVLVEDRTKHQQTGYRQHGYRSNNNTYIPQASTSSTSSSSTSQTSTSAPMDLSAAELNAINNTPLKKLTDAEREELRRQGKCFRCRQRAGHIARDCTFKFNQPSKNTVAQQ